MNEDNVISENQESPSENTNEVGVSLEESEVSPKSALRNDFSQTQQSSALDEGHDIQAVYDVPVQVSAVIGRATMPVHQLLKLGHGAVVELDRKIGEAIDIYVNNRLIARGELIVIDDRVGVTMTEIIKYEQ